MDAHRSSPSKKMKKDDQHHPNDDGDDVMKTLNRDKEHVRRLRRHILSFPDLDGDSCAVRAALNGLDKESRRIERDEKLFRKFSGGGSKRSTDTGIADDWTEEDGASTANTSTNATTTTSGPGDGDGDLVDEWQDVPPGSPTSSDESDLGRRLAAAAVSRVARERVGASDRAPALALALHAAMVGDALRFRCTGLPDNDDAAASGGGGGFAEPIRELPRHRFLPDGFDDGGTSSVARLRYRKRDVGAVVLEVRETTTTTTAMNDTESATPRVEIRLCPGSSSSSTTTSDRPFLSFPVDDHFNRESFVQAQRSATGSKKIPPALHYKRLAVLLTRFVNTFDLGDVADGDDEHDKKTTESVSRPPPSHQPPPTSSSRPVVVDAPRSARTARSPRYCDDGRAPTIRDHLVPPPPVPVGGDFDGDLRPGFAPARPYDDGFFPNSSPGNLMGPDHPSFRGGGGVGPPLGGGRGGRGMRPRFDPIHGGPAGPDGLNGGRGRGRRGFPNPDHLKPPNDDYGDMFM